MGFNSGFKGLRSWASLVTGRGLGERVSIVVRDIGWR